MTRHLAWTGARLDARSRPPVALSSTSPASTTSSLTTLSRAIPLSSPSSALSCLPAPCTLAPERLPLSLLVDPFEDGRQLDGWEHQRDEVLEVKHAVKPF